MKLWYGDSTNPRKVCAGAKYLGARLEYQQIDFELAEHRDPDFLALNPNGKAPVLEDDGKVLWESNAILQYLAVKSDTDRARDFWPRDGRQTEVMRWMCWDMAHFSRHGGVLYYENGIKPAFGVGVPDDAVINVAHGFWRVFAATLDDYLQGRDHLVGDSWTLADFTVATVLPYAEFSKLPLEDFPEICRWYTGLEALPAWADPWP